MNIRYFILPFLLGALALSGCNESSIGDFAPNPNRPLPDKLVQKIKSKGMKTTSPIMMRIIKDEHLLEIWKQKDNGRYDLVTAYNICAWSGKLGQKMRITATPTLVFADGSVIPGALPAKRLEAEMEQADAEAARLAAAKK